MKLWRSRQGRAALLPALMGVLAMAGTIAWPAGPAAADPPADPAPVLSDLPLILDVSTPHDGPCTGPLHGTTAVYFPPGVPEHAELEWRILGGGQPIRSGITVVQNEVMTVGFDIRRDELPPDGLLRVDARARVPGGDVSGYGKSWSFRVDRECRPLHVVSVGDSVLWGQSLDQNHTFADLVATALGARVGREAQLHDYTVSGATLDSPSLHPACPTGDNATPDVFCQLEQAAADATARGYPVDLVLMDGCLNDLDPFFGIPVGVTPGTQDLAAAVRRECGGVGAESENPAASVPYFSGARLGYGGRGMREAMQAAHRLPGAPKVLAGDYFHGYDAGRVPQGLTQRWSEFVRLSGEVFRQAATEVNAAAGEVVAAAADGLFTQDAVQAGDRRPGMNPLGDEAISLRQLACPKPGELPQCLTVPTAGPPDTDGARRYAEAFLLNPRLSEWFGSGGPVGAGFSASRTAVHAGTPVAFDANAAGAAIRQYDWYFGDGSHETTTDAVTSHAYYGAGPQLPRLVVTDMTGHRSLFELDHPITVD
ncbi:PKD domain-containing protein [Nocardia yunnanensis]|uniref:PKD domain-containing protein n=1 Tax=Nocardia yunnanensis TaxID=2382165 RepID=A0A386Z5V3_9NOCA|nr:PKD domain-containing protein [Nocardia yunnanensis]AYF73098.1 PKD domain-containing protein [Nocardia yunnanensis]